MKAQIEALEAAPTQIAKAARDALDHVRQLVLRGQQADWIALHKLPFDERQEARMILGLNRTPRAFSDVAQVAQAAQEVATAIEILRPALSSSGLPLDETLTGLRKTAEHATNTQAMQAALGKVAAVSRKQQVLARKALMEIKAHRVREFDYSRLTGRQQVVNARRFGLALIEGATGAGEIKGASVGDTVLILPKTDPKGERSSCSPLTSGAQPNMAPPEVFERHGRKGTTSDYDGTIVHEYAHAIEYVNPEMVQLSKAWRDDFATRSNGEKLETRKLSELQPGSSYEPHEVARVGKAFDPYVLKVYSYDVTEVYTMGFQTFYHDQHAPPIMRLLHLEHFAFCEYVLARGKWAMGERLRLARAKAGGKP